MFLYPRYTIVYAKSGPRALIEHEAAYTLRQRLAATYEEALAVLAWEEGMEMPQNAILLGDITGIFSAQNQFAMQNTGYKILLTAGSTAAYDDLIEAFLVGAEEELPTDDAPLLCDCKDQSIGTRHGALRVIYHNIYGYDRTPTINPIRRYTLEATLYREYDTDLLCLQEYDDYPRKLLAPLLEEAGYQEVPADRGDFPSNCSPILYDPEKLTLLDHGFYPFSWKSEVFPKVRNNHNSKNLTWAVFEQKSTGRRFVNISVHFYYSPDASQDMTNRVESNKGRIKNAEEMHDVIENVIRKKHDGAWRDLPVLLGGDLNCGFANKVLPSLIASAGGRIALDLLEEYGMKHLQKTADLFSDNTTAYCGYPTYDEELGYYDHVGDVNKHTYDKAIDHIYTWGEGIQCHTFDILDSSYAKRTSDHCPILVDLDLI